MQLVKVMLYGFVMVSLALQTIFFNVQYNWGGKVTKFGGLERCLSV